MTTKPTPATPIHRKKADRGAARRRQMAVETTYRETEYIAWLSANHIPVVVKLVDGSEERGWIEYSDRDIIRLTRTGSSNIFIFKERVKYLYEEPTSLSQKRYRVSNP